MTQALNVLRWMLDDRWYSHVFDLQIQWLSRSLDELRMLAVYSWRRAACTDLLRRQGYAGLSSIDAKVSFGSFTTHDMAKAELAATIQDGAFYTNQFPRVTPRSRRTA